jgi:hypothetical protein
MGKRVKGWIAAAAGMMIMVLALGGCETMDEALGTHSEPSPPPAPRLYDFPDVFVPVELSLDRDDSFVYEYGGRKMGMLYLKGGVEVESLVNFFTDRMIKEGWTLVNSVKYSKVMLNFVKFDRNCQIFIEEKMLTTAVQIWVNPLKPM